MGNFQRDKEKGDVAENIVLNILEEKFPDKKFKRVTGKNADYDIIQDTRSKNKLTVEVKFDIRAIETGNLCFEFTNGKKPTGVCVSKAEEIWYVLKTNTKNTYSVIKFNRADLLQSLLYHAITKPTKGIRLVYGGDRRAFGLIIIPIKTVLEEEFGEVIDMEYSFNV